MVSALAYRERLRAVSESLSGNSEQVYLDKGTTSNLFRYGRRSRQAKKALVLKDFNHVLELDSEQATLETEGLATYQTIVSYCLERGFLPTVCPELKHITLGGATVGIGIESTGHRYGFVHDGLIEADVLLPDGEVVTCSADNEHADLYHALGNSYGTLGYILRARIRLIKAKPNVCIRNARFSEVVAYLSVLENAARGHESEFIEGLMFSPNELHLTLADMVDEAPYLDDIYGTEIFYRTLRKREEMYLRTEDYIFRFDPDWFWNVPETVPYMWFRRFAPQRLRSSGFYNRYVALKYRLMGALGIKPDRSEEQLIQDWEVPWPQAEELLTVALRDVDLQGQPWVALPILARGDATLYPLRANELYFNLGCYCFTRRPRADEDYYYTKLLDQTCFELGGLKMLYSSTFLSEEEFDRLYNGEAYHRLKATYDPRGNAPTLYQKAVLAR